MSLPSSYTRVLALLKRISPSWPSLDANKSTGKEMGSIAVALAMAADAVDAVIDEIFPDTTTFLIGRWEAITKSPTRTSDDLPTRRSRVLSTLRRISGPRIAQLEKMLAAPLAISVDDMVWEEQTRSPIEDTMTDSTGAVSLSVPVSPSILTARLGKPWPGVVDDFGVKVYIALSAVGTTVATLRAPDGTQWTIPVNAASGWYQTRTVFTGHRAGGTWTLTISDSTAPTLTEFRVLVSNDIDSGRIAQFFVLRDPGLAGTADLVEAQRLLRRTALGHMRARVVETLAFKTGDTYSRLGRDPLGA